MAAIADEVGNVDWGEGNIHQAPSFARDGYWDTNNTSEDPEDDFWVNGDYHLQSERGRWSPADGNWIEDDATSPCIDAADPSLCIGHEPYPNGNRVNMGAYGTTLEASKSLSDIECFDPSHPDYAEWTAVGKPICWCYRRQCHGDTDCTAEGNSKSGFTHVFITDLDVLIAAWNIAEPPHGPGVASVEGAIPGICADFAHNVEGNAKSGFRRVFISDLNILIANWRVLEPPHGMGISPNCQDLEAVP